MGAQQKIEPDNLAIWRAVEKTDPRHTKKVNQRGGFTAISAHYQVMQATAQFGPVGIGWGYVNDPPIFHDNLVIVPVTLWHGSRENAFGPVYGSAEIRNAKGYLDADAPKKAATDGLTKALSHLGFNADVFLGRFDDNKYIQQMEREFADADRGQSQGGEVGPGQPISDAQWEKIVSLCRATKTLGDEVKKHIGAENLKVLTPAQFSSAVEYLETKLAEAAKAETNAKAKEPV